MLNHLISMMFEEDCLTKIEGQRGFFQILLALNEESELLQSQLYNNKPLLSISNNATALRAINLLVKYNLITVKKKRESNGKYYVITDKGRKCAELFMQLHELIQH